MRDSSTPTRPGEPAAVGRTWWVGLANWVLKEGTYPDFRVGERRRFALELGYSRLQRLRRTGPQAGPGCRHLGGAGYEVTGEVLRASPGPGPDGCFVLDVGLLAYAHEVLTDELQPPDRGDWVTGRISLHVDHFAYLDELAHRPGMPPLIYTWRIDAIEELTAGTIRVEPGHPLHTGPDTGGVDVPDPTGTWLPVDETSAWGTERSYRLGCTLLPDPPTSTVSGPGDPGGLVG